MNGRKTSGKTAVDVLYGRLKERIISGVYEEGFSLRQEALARDFGTSRIPVREALFLLEGDGLVEFKPHKGAVVKSLTLEELKELFHLRAVLECDMLRHAIPRMREEDFIKAEAAHQKYRKISKTGKDHHLLPDLNLEFHMCLYRPSGLAMSMNMVRSINANTDRYRRFQLGLHGPAKCSYREHAALLEKCREWDVEGAVNILEKHILSLREVMAVSLCKRPDKFLNKKPL